MRIKTSRFGSIEIPEQAILTFPSGVMGFPASTRYIVLDHDRDVPFKWLQSLDEESLAFVVTDPVLCKPDYQVVLTPDDMADLKLSSERDLAVMVILTIPSDDPSRVTANLRGPLIVNQHSRLAKQMIVREDHPTRYPVFS
ncbi:MAG TPA: flagellar assembly protein FliW [Nitrospiraceae bacterium]|nr:flagellar assembly protein FliW [Nitrospiraceae bacterium]